VILSAPVAKVRSLDVMLDTVVQDGTAIVICRGRVLHGATARRFRGCIGDVLSRYRRVVVDLGGVAHMDARGLGMIAALIRQARMSERQLVLAAAAGRINYLLRLTRLDTLVDCVPSHALRDAPESDPVGHLVRT
jgi:anti-anti-sigma factor